MMYGKVIEAQEFSTQLEENIPIYESKLFIEGYERRGV